MYRKYFAIFLLLSFISLGAFAQDTIFTNSDSEQFDLQPLNYHTETANSSADSIPVYKSNSNSTNVPLVEKAKNSDLSNQNFKSAVNNLDNAQVEIREQLASYSQLMTQSKASYEAKKDEYRAYKKQYNTLKRKMNKIEKSKKIIQDNIYVPTQN